MAEEGKVSLPETIADVFEKVDKYAGIIAAIIAALTFSQGNRFASYAFVVIGYVLMASFLWRVMTQRSVVRRAIATVRPLLEKREYRYPRSQRWIAGIALVVLTLFSFGWVGVNGWRDYQAREGLLFPRAKENELLVIIAQFDNRSAKGIDPTQRIHDRLRKEFEEAGITNGRLEMAPEITSLNEARRIGERHGAVFVIWGWFDDVGFTPNFTIVKEKPFLLEDLELKEEPVEPARDFSLYIREGLPAQMAYFSTLTIGQLYCWDGKFEKALSAFDIAIDNALQSGTLEGLADVYFYRGYIHGVVLDDSQHSLANYNEVIELKPNYAEAYYNRGCVYDDLGQHWLAIQDYDKAIELKPDLAEAYGNRGNAYQRQGDYERAIADLSKFIELKADDAKAYYNRGTVYAKQGDYEQAIQDFGKAIELKPDYAEAYSNRGLTYYHKGDYEQAIRDLDRAIELEPDLAVAYNNRGAAHHDKGDYKQAIADYDRVIELDPNLAEAYYNRGRAYVDQGDYGRAIWDFDRTIELEPNFASAYYNRGLAYADKGEYNMAIADYEKAIELAPGLAEVYNNRGNAYRYKGEYDLAIADYEKAIELRPDDAAAYNNRGAAYHDESEYDLAIADFDKAIELKPDYAEAYYNRGLAYAHKGEYELAIADFSKAIELRPDFALAYYGRGLVHKIRGEKEEAVRDFERFLELSEDEYWRKEAEKQLRELRGR